MSGFPTANFSDSAQGLFTEDEIRSLMRIEYERAARYDYAVALMLIDVDRIEYLHDLYGYESKEEILQAIIQLLRGVTRASDFLGCMNEGKLMALFPHTGQEAGMALAERLLVGSRRLKFESGTRTLRTTLSIGLVIATAEPVPWEDFVETADHALAYAIDSGGDRYVMREGAEELLDRLRADIEEEEAALALEHERLDRMRSALPHGKEVVQKSVHIRPPEPEDFDPTGGAHRDRDEDASRGTLRFPDQVPSPEEAEMEAKGAIDPEDRERFFELVGPIFQSLGARTPEIQSTMDKTVELLMQTVSMAREEVLAEQTESHANAVTQLERRVSKLKQALAAAEDEVRRVAAMKEVDPGLASIYRSVQGLDDGADNASAKREMLSVLFEANVKLREDIKGKEKKKD